MIFELDDQFQVFSDDCECKNIAHETFSNKTGLKLIHFQII